ncbi:chemotaxis protein [Tsukamurella pulmonis]|uniref:MFS transporter, DHA1 family, chloramphenicol resistance protein n=1 Tax=Tsukamurella pulmonis TaxID=47312 RepID=A0A1H1BKW9_9ACTN|nr:MFS transporter [Tsukamurella pulmonis]KXO90302.1 chemotaxis protein [Tsukamurella pulmonis]SDQ52390.1 MFS transporter, DHA1 family, chloramphenicol resistance protein [Tsukamurella pulmonis]SUP25049.1 Purine efflux pump PbuE [Tsukamurella pulmonis]
MPRLVLFLALAVFAMGTSEFMLSGVLPALADDLAVTTSAAGGLVSAYALGMVVGAPATAALARRWPPRAALLVFLAVFAAVHAVGALTASLPVLLVTRVLAAVANAGFLAVAFTVATAAVGPDRRARALSVLLAGTTIAMVAGVPAGAVVGAAAGWRTLFWAVAVLCLPPFVAILAVAPGDRSEAAGGRPSLRGEIRALRNPRAAVLLALTALVNAGTFGMLTYLAVPVQETLSPSWIPGVLLLFGVGACLGVALVGRIADARPWALLATAAPTLVGAWAALATGGRAPLVLLTAVPAAGLLAFAVGGTLIALVIDSAAGRTPTMAGAYATAALNVGAVAGPVGAGAALERVGGGAGPAWFAASAVAVALVLGGLLRRAGR